MPFHQFRILWDDNSSAFEILQLKDLTVTINQIVSNNRGTSVHRIVSILSIYSSNFDHTNENVIFDGIQLLFIRLN